ncbi:extracellular solute-binding protein [Thermanaerothrix daxensis]|uniref:extracellular solute-binding protein n=1 Tax=Thermanaerothrix daxensis TaxID=869279 RepID=UPI0006C8FF81|nr:extracellular solute-binding protein [Thermanaerothrix daxensis]
MRRNVIFLILALLTILAAFLAACAPTTTPTPTTEPGPPKAEATTAAPPQPAQEKITVIFPRHEADITGAFEARVREFEKTIGIQVDLTQSDWDSVADRVIPEMATGGSAYDVVEFDNGWVAEWCGAGWVTPLNDFMPANFTDGMIPGLVDLFSCPDGKLYGVVWNNDTRFFYYNAAKLEAAGFKEPPRTWQEFKQMSLAAKEKGVVQYGMAPSWNQEWALANEFHFWTYTFGGKIVDENGCFEFNKDPNTLAALQFMIDSIKEGVANPAGLTYDQATSQDAFLKGDTLFLPQGIAGLMAYTQDPSISKVAGQVEVGLVPGATPDLSATLTLPEAYAIPVNSKHKEAAWKFIQFMTSRENNEILAKEIGLLPIWTDLYTDPDLLAKYPFWANFQAQLATARGLSKLTWYGDFVDVTIAEVHKALAGEQTAQQALDNMAKGLAQFECKP